MKDKVGPILIVIVLIAAVAATTASWFIWKQDEKNRIGVSFETNGADTECITYSTSQNNNQLLIPVSNKEKGYITSVDIVQNCNVNLYADFKLKLDKLPQELKNKSFKYIFTENSKIIEEDNFEGKKQGEILTIATNQKIENISKNYKLYLWIDGNENNDNSMQNKHYEFSLEANIIEKNE